MIKKLFSNPIWHKYLGIPLCALVVFSSLFLAYLLKICIMPLSEGYLLRELIDSVNKEWYMNAFFSDRNSLDGNDYDDSDIAIIDVKESFSSRDNIAYIIKKISSLKPRIICLDFAFSDNESYDSVMNENLKRTINEIKDTTNIVVVAYKGQQSVINQSFFTDSLHLEYGLSDFLSFTEFIPYISDSIPRITTKIAEKANIYIQSLPKHLVINYRNKTFFKIPVKDSMDVELNLRDILKNKIIKVSQVMAHLHNLT